MSTYSLIKGPFVTEKFTLPEHIKEKLHSLKDPMKDDVVARIVNLRTYSRLKDNGQKETWAETIIRVVEGVFSIRKTHYINNNLGWEEDMEYVEKFTMNMFNMKFLPPGRGLAMMGTEKVKNCGSAFLFNCFHSELNNLSYDCGHVMDFLACGIGAGVTLNWNGEVHEQSKEEEIFVVPDDREGWVNSLEFLIDSYVNHGKKPIFDYSKIRKYGEPIKGFGGKASGYQVLEKLHLRVDKYFKTYLAVKKCENDGRKNDPQPFIDLFDFFYKSGDLFCPNYENSIQNIREQCNKGLKTYGKTRLQADIICSIAACIVAGNIRRSAIILLADPKDNEFKDLKNLSLNPERSAIYWTSNNSLVLSENQQFEEYLPLVSDRIRENGEPGIINMINIKKYGRYNEIHPDPDVTGINPCGEEPLANKELCNISDIVLSNCLDKDGNFDENIFEEACDNACFYCSTVTLLNTHRPDTNCIQNKNRRIGVGVTGVAWLYENLGVTKLIKILRRGYKKVVQTNIKLADNARIPRSIRTTTVKPCGTLSKLAHCTPGMHFPTSSHMVRTIRISKSSKMCMSLIKKGVPYEKDAFSDNTLVFSLPYSFGNIRSAQEVTMWEQATLLYTLQREWSDSAVSCTITFNKHESKDIERLIANSAPMIKSMSLLPLNTENYKQMPERKISIEEYLIFKDWLDNDIDIIDEEQVEDVKGCTNDNCEINYDEEYINDEPKCEKFTEIQTALLNNDKTKLSQIMNIDISEDEKIYLICGHEDCSEYILFSLFKNLENKNYKTFAVLKDGTFFNKN